MQDRSIKNISTDVLIIGTGAAGLRAAIEARRYGANVLVVDKSLIGVNNNTVFAGGGLKAALPGILNQTMNKAYDTPEEHMIDTIRYGGYLNNQRLVERLAIEAPARLLELQEFGVKHFENLRIHKDTAKYGGKITKPLAETSKKMGVRFRPHTFVYDFIVEDKGIRGAVCFDSLSAKQIFIQAKSIIAATGGAGEVYLRNNSVSTATGEIFSLAYRAGAELIDMELVQIDPYILAEPGLPMWYILPCDARFLAILRNAQGEAFMTKYLPLKGKLEDPFPKRYGIHPPDVRELISRAMYTEVMEGRGENGAVMLDCRHVPEAEWLKDPADIYARKAILRGFDLQKKMIHMLPGAIHNLGGIKINEKTESSIAGLYAAGECSGLIHGAGRLGGNALSDCIVFGAIAGKNAAEYASSCNGQRINGQLFEEKQRLFNQITEQKSENYLPGDIRKKIQTIIWESAGPVRSEDKLKRGLDQLEVLKEKELPFLFAPSLRPLHIKDAMEAFNMATVGEMILRSAIFRKESRGEAHYRIDYQKQDNTNWFKNIILKLSNGNMQLETAPIEITRFRPSDIEG